MKDMMKRERLAGIGAMLAGAALSVGDGNTVSASGESGPADCIYTAAAVSVNDALAGEQWALSNDGTFQMEEGQNQFPVFDRPFSTPFNPGMWKMPEIGVGKRPGNEWSGGGRVFRRDFLAAGTDSGQSSAVAGIDINAEQGWNLYNGGEREVTIAVIDTGADIFHEDLGDIVWVNQDEISGNGIDDDGNGYVDDVYGWNFYNNNNQVYTGSEDSHGTHGVGTIGASADNGTGITGIVRGDKIKVMVLKVLGGTDGSGDTESLIQAIRYAEANGASVCNLSLSTESYDQALYDAMAQSGMLFIAAAGNGTSVSELGVDDDLIPSYPASFDLDNIISVANISYDGTLHYSSNYGALSVDLAAPGTYILSTTPDGGYSYMTGTSMAAPMVAAAAAMVYSYDSDITLSQVKEILLGSVTPLNSLSGKVLSGGLLNLGAAMEMAAALN